MYNSANRLTVRALCSVSGDGMRGSATAEGWGLVLSHRFGGSWSRVPLMAGWLFADLCLVLFVVGMGAAPTVLPHRHIVPVKTTRAAAKPKPLALERRPIDIWVNISPSNFSSQGVSSQAASELLSSLRQQIAAQHMSGHRAGFVLLFASGSISATSQAIDSADTVLRLIRSRDGSVFGQASGEGLWNGQGDDFHFQIFFYA